MGNRPNTSMDDQAFDLLIACADWPADHARDKKIVSALTHLSDDWGPFIAQVKRHQLAIIAATSLQKAGIEPPENLMNLATRQKRRALLLAGEAVRVTAALEARGLSVTVIKGPLLSQQLYDDPAMRESVDLDILVDWSDFRAARDALTALDYRLISNEPPWGDWRIDPWRGLAKDIALLHPERGITLELHHRLKSPASLLPGITRQDATETITMAGRAFSTFRREDQFAYLCVHAATSLWNRLKWLADIRALLSGMSVTEIAALQGHSARLGTERCTALALVLCNQLWGQDIPSDVLQIATTDPKLADLVDASLKRLRGADRRPSSFANTLDRKRMMYLRDDAEYRRAMTTELIYDNELLEEFRIPKPLRFFYLPLRIGMFILRKLGLRHNPARVALARATHSDQG